ncbi:MAG: hypothetical protein ACEPO8_13810 [Rhodothermaceae bacterium]
MITGHFTTALVPYAKHKDYPLFYLLLITQIQDLLIPVDLIIQNLTIFDLKSLQMTYSHDIIPTLIMSILAGIITYLIYKKKDLALWCFGLVIFHEVCDLFSGFSHNLFGTHTHSFGFDLYRENTLLAGLIELTLAVACFLFFVWKRKKEELPITNNKLIILTIVIFLPIVSMIIMPFFGKTLL